MSAANGPQHRDEEGASGIRRREVLLTVGGVAAAVGAGAAIWAASIRLTTWSTISERSPAMAWSRRWQLFS